MPNFYVPYNDKPVGFKKQATEIRNRLIRGPKTRDVVLLTGMGGLGKTTLARRVYEEEIVAERFEIRAWCIVSREYNYMDLCQKIYSQVHDGEIIRTAVGIDEKLRQRLLGRKYLIVLDDIWSIDAWDKMNLVLPCDGNSRSRILVTSRERELISDAKHIPLPFFTTREGWELLQVKLFKEDEYTDELEEIGLEIAEKCGGLPFVVSLVAGLLEKVEKSEQKWKEFMSDELQFAFGDEIQSNEVVQHSYNHLPDHLKPCLLYFAAFPEDERIDASYMMALWIAEGFIRDDERSMEDEAKNLLNHLISRNLVMESETKYDGSILKCSVHDIVHDFCVKNAKTTNFLEVIRSQNVSDPTPTFSQQQQRICFHSYQGNQIPLELVPRGCSIRTLLGSKIGRGSDIHGKISDGSWNVKQYDHLTILNLEFISVDESILSPINSLMIHLKYLALCLHGSGSVSPSSLDNLEHLITLKLASQKNLHLPKFLWNMKSLRHLFIDHYCSSCMKKPLSEIGQVPNSEILQSFSTISLNVVEETLLKMLPYLKHLSCYVRRSDQFPDIGFLDHLESLQLTCKDGYPHFVDDLKLDNLPSGIKELCLSGFSLSPSAISVIAELSNLEALQLHHCNFDDSEWIVEDEIQFEKLKYFELTFANLEKWDSSAESFPRLEQLIVRSCWQLEELPLSFSEIITLKVIVVQWCDSFVDSSKKRIIEDAKENLGKEDLEIKIIGKR